MSLTDKSSLRIVNCEVLADVSVESNICEYEIYYTLVRDGDEDGKLWLMGNRKHFEFLGAEDDLGPLKKIEKHTKDYFRYELIPNQEINSEEPYAYSVKYRNYIENVITKNGLSNAVLVRSFGCHCDRYELIIKGKRNLRVLSTCPDYNIKDHNKNRKSIVFTNLAQAKPAAVSVTFDYGLIPIKVKSFSKWTFGLCSSAAAGHYFPSILAFIKGVL